LAEQLDAHRKRQQAEHADLTMTGMYNVLEKLRAGETLTAKDKVIHEQGLVSVLKQLHDDLDAAVFEAYGWPTTLTDAQILERLVALNATRAAEEAAGTIRWLRPEYQKERCQGPGVRCQEQTQLGIQDQQPSVITHSPATASPERVPWPKALPEQMRALRDALASEPGPATPENLAKRFIRARSAKVEELLRTLVTLGQAREAGNGQFTAG